MSEEEAEIEALSISDRLEVCMRTLPVRLGDLVDEAKRNPHGFLVDNLLNRIIVILLNEQDDRISDKQTKLDCIQILTYIARHSMQTRSYLRIVLRPIVLWFDHNFMDENVPVKNPEILRKMKTVFAICWKITRRMIKAVINNVQETVEEAKVIFIRQYAATQFQAIIRGFVSRLKLKRFLVAQAEAQKQELIQWSVVNIQRVARSYIARKTTVRSMKIRKTLSHEVLHIAERYLKDGDVWGFLKEVNEELKRVNNVVLENESREYNWATNFIEKVVEKRQSEFNESWERFPKALAEFNKNKATEEGTLLDKNTMGGIGGKSTSSTGAVSHQTTASHGRSGGNGSPLRSALKNSSSSVGAGSTGTGSVTASTQLAPLRSNSATTLTSKSTSKTASFSKTSNIITPADVAAANAKSYRNLPGPMVRKAVTKTVQVEVAHELNRLVNGEFRSKKLAQDIRDAYGAESDPTPKPLHGVTSHHKTTSSAPVGGAVAPPPTRRKKKRVDINGRIIPDEGKISATHEVDWLSDAAEDPEAVEAAAAAAVAVPYATGGPKPVPRGDKSRPTTADQIQIQQQPGNNLLLDVPRGVEDSIERLLHAAALRCFVPDFFRGVDYPVHESERNNWAEEEEDAILERHKKNKTPVSINSNASYAYQVYLNMPVGLAKMRYEVECKKFSQGSINKLRLKGLNYLPDVSPTSKLIMCLKSVDTPRVLLNTAVDLYIELRNMGKAPVLGATSKSTKEEFNKIAPITMPRDKNASPKRKKSPSRGTAQSVGQLGDLLNPDEEAESRPGTADSAASARSRTSTGSAKKPRKPKAKFINSEGQVMGKGKQPQARVIFDELTPQEKKSPLPGQLLLQMVEENGVWCDLKATVEDLFLHAAFLVVPHRRVTRKISGDLVETITEMGNLAFKEHSRDLLRMTNEEDKREAVKERFQSAFILTTPFCLYLKNKHIYIVEDLLSINLADLQMPKPLEVQLEALLTAVVAKCSNSKLVPVPRNLLSTAKKMFMVPMLYDPKFQRSPFDPYGRPPRLQKGGVKVLKKLKEKDEIQERDAKALVDMNKVANAKQISMHMDEPITIWSPKKQLKSQHSSVTFEESGTEGGGVGPNGEWMPSIQESEYEHDLKLGGAALEETSNVLMQEDSMDDSKWTFHIDAMLNQGILSHQQQDDGSLHSQDVAPGHQLEAVSPNGDTKGAAGSGGGASGNKSKSGKKKSHGLTAPHITMKDLRTPMQQNQDFRLTDIVNDQVFHHSYVCHYPNCKQVFSRMYTYKIHLKSHENFGAYHDYKRQPQLYLDSDAAEVADIAQARHVQSYSLPPVIMKTFKNMNVNHG